MPHREPQVGDIVQYCCSPHEVIALDNVGDGEYTHVKIRCLEASPDSSLKYGEVSETFSGRTSLIKAKE